MELIAKDPATVIQAELGEIERYKWIESEKEGRDIGGNRAALEWLHKHQEAWCRAMGWRFACR